MAQPSIPTHARIFSTDSIISPHAALEALALTDDTIPSSPPRASSSRYPDGLGRSPPTNRASPGSGFRRRSMRSTNGNGGAPDGYDEYDEDTVDDTSERLFVRARFDFDASDPSALSFRAGEVIEVITMLESGWWDGMLGETRGWFPSNFVEEVELEMEEEDEVLAGDAGGDEGVEEYGVGGIHARDRGEGHGAPRGGGGAGPERGVGEEGPALAVEDLLASQWGYETQGLDELARQMMDEAEEDEAKEFEIAAARVRQRTAETASVGLGGPGQGSDMDEFGVPRNERNAMETEGDVTVRPRQNGQGPTTVADRAPPVEPEDAWIPSLTPDGQVYYHNTQTGEDSWELPMSTPLDDDLYGAADDDYFHTFGSGASTSDAFAAPTAADDGDFRIPPKAQGDIPYPWVSRLSDDGTHWFYVNRLTGQMQRDFPKSLAGASVPSRDGPSHSTQPSAGSARGAASRLSLELQRKAVAEWEKRTREALEAVLQPKPRPTMGGLMDNISDTLREIFEAAVAGSAAEEEMSRAVDLGSEAGIAAALLREESAVDMLASAHASILGAIRELLSAFGYVGPIDKMEEMPRPNWTGDMTLIGSIGLLSSNVHAAVTSKRVPDSGLSTSAEVMRSASKLRDVVGMFPQSALAGTTAGGWDSAQGKALEAWIGVDNLGELVGGRWGFGKVASERAFDQTAALGVQKAKADFYAAMGAGEEDVLGVLRAATVFRSAIDGCDIAAVIDLDGDRDDAGGSRVREEELRRYTELVGQARHALRDLDDAALTIDWELAALFMSSSELSETATSLAQLGPAVSAATKAFSTLLAVVGEQASLVDSSSVRGAIGARSPRARKARPQSTVSTQSRGSRASRRSAFRQRVRGLEEEFLDAEDLELERLAQAGQRELLAGSIPGVSGSNPPSAGANASQISLARAGGPDPSATSSTTSLPYQKTESDTASTKASNRTSFMKTFMRGRSGSDVDDGRGTRGKAPSRKLAKILGEDVSAINLASVPPPVAAPQTPWYLSEDYASDEIVFDDRGGVKAGTLRALVARLTPHGSTDTSFFQAFMLTFRSFTSGDELLDLLFERYDIPEPGGITELQLVDWKKQKQTPIRLRVSNVLRAWLDVHFMEAQDKRSMLRIEEFATTTLVASGSETLSKTLLNLIQRRRQGETEGPRRIISGGMLSPPAPLIPRVPAGRELRLTDIAPIELARQLTIIEFGNFQRIKPVECLHKAWNDEDEQAAPNVRRVIHTANKLAGWVSLLVLQPRDPKSRATVMKFFIQTAAELKSMNNFSSMAGVVAGLNAAPVDRLKRTKELLSTKTLLLKSELDRTMDSSKNFLNYKEALKTINPPCVPFFGFYLSALTFIEDGNKDHVFAPTASGGGMTPSVSSSSIASDARGGPTGLSGLTTTSTATTTTATTAAPPGPMLINFFKRSLSAEILRDIQQYQSQPYNLARCRSVYEFLVDGMQTVEQSGDLYERSLMLEPREREEERITRMLHDSVRLRSKNEFQLGLMTSMF